MKTEDQEKADWEQLRKSREAFGRQVEASLAQFFAEANVAESDRTLLQAYREYLGLRPEAPMPFDEWLENHAGYRALQEAGFHGMGMYWSDIRAAARAVRECWANLWDATATQPVPSPHDAACFVRYQPPKESAPFDRQLLAPADAAGNLSEAGFQRMYEAVAESMRPALEAVSWGRAKAQTCSAAWVQDRPEYVDLALRPNQRPLPRMTAWIRFRRALAWPFKVLYGLVPACPSWLRGNRRAWAQAEDSPEEELPWMPALSVWMADSRLWTDMYRQFLAFRSDAQDLHRKRRELNANLTRFLEMTGATIKRAENALALECPTVPDEANQAIERADATLAKFADWLKAVEAAQLPLVEAAPVPQ